MNMEQEAKQDVIYRSFRNKEDEAIEKSSILLSKVFYLLDHKVNYFQLTKTFSHRKLPISWNAILNISCLS